MATRILIMLIITGASVYAGPHKISWQGDTTLKENTVGIYVLKVKNTDTKDYTGITLRLEGVEQDQLHVVTAYSPDCAVSEDELSEGKLIAYGGPVPVGESVMLLVSLKAGSLEHPGDVETKQLVLSAYPNNVRKGTIKRTITIYRAD